MYLISAKLVIDRIVASMVTEKHSRSSPGIKTYYLDPAQEGVIERIRRETNCYIEVKSPELLSKAAETIKQKPTFRRIGIVRNVYHTRRMSYIS